MLNNPFLVCVQMAGLPVLVKKSKRSLVLLCSKCFLGNQHHSSISQRFYPRNASTAAYTSTKLRGVKSFSEACNSISSVRSDKNIAMEKELKLKDYDCIGFDLDNTVGEYQLFANSKLEFELLAKYLIEQKNYDSSILAKSFESDVDFIMRGLILDTAKGNILKMGYDGRILRASHGTKRLSEKEIITVYGTEKRWDVTSQFCKDMLVAWEGPLSQQMRTLLDYFDTPVSLLFARAVDSIDNKLGKKAESYSVFSDVCEGLYYLYSREHFESNKGDYFPTLKSSPEKYVRKCDSKVLQWLKELKKTKKLFLITGSNVDYASFTATHALGEDWRDYFDIVVCYSKKPGFFTSNRPFLELDGIKETNQVPSEKLKLNNIYSQGNWQDLYKFLSRVTEKTDLKCLYIGDNLLQDVFTPAEYTKCDTIAVSEEVSAECNSDPNFRHPAESVLKSKFWGSYFYDEELQATTYWGKVINHYAKVCVPSLKALSSVPLDHPMKCFVQGKEIHGKDLDTVGYFPILPDSLQKINKAKE